MSRKKEPIPIENIRKLNEILSVLQESMKRAEEEFDRVGIAAPMMEGWPTLYRGLRHVVEQSLKLTGPTSKLTQVDVNSILLPHQEPRDNGKLTKADKQALKAAEQEAKYDRGKKRPRSQESS